MKITSIKAVPCGPPMFKHLPFKFPTWNYVFVKVETDEGIVGWGDATCGPNAVIQMVDEFGELILGEDPFPIEQHWLKLHHHYFARGGPIQNSAIAGRGTNASAKASLRIYSAGEAAPSLASFACTSSSHSEWCSRAHCSSTSPVPIASNAPSMPIEPK